MGLSSQVQLIFRIAPSNPDSTSIIETLPHNQKCLLKLKHNKNATRDFLIESVYDSKSKYEKMLQEYGDPLVQKIFLGFQCNVFSFGAHASGKTNTLFGENGFPSGLKKGFGVRIIESIFDQIHQRKNYVNFEMYISFLEISNNQLFDLTTVKPTADSYSSSKVFLQKNDKHEMFIQNLNIIQVFSKDDVIQCIEKVNSIIYSKQSLHSTTLFTLTIAQQGKGANSNDKLIIGSLNLIELHELSETVRDVIYAIHHKQPLIPYQKNPLTMILKNALTIESCYILLVGHIFDSLQHYDQTLQTLVYSFSCLYTKQIAISSEQSIILEKEKQIQKLETQVSQLFRTNKEQQKLYEDKIKVLEAKVEQINRQSEEMINRPFFTVDDEKDKALVKEKEMRTLNETKLVQVNQERNILKEKIATLEHSLKEIQLKFSSDEKKLKDSLMDYRSKNIKLSQEVKELNEKLNVNKEENDKKVKNILDRLAEEHKDEVEKLTTIIAAIPEAVKNAEAKNDVLKLKTLEKEKEMDKKYATDVRTIDQTNVKATTEIKDMYEDALERKDKEIHSLKEELSATHKKLEETRLKKEKEIELLLDYSGKLSMIIRNLETGVYPVKSRFFMKHIQIFEKDKPEVIRAELETHMKDRLSKVDEYIQQSEERAQEMLKQQDALLSKISTPLTTQRSYTLNSSRITSRGNTSEPGTPSAVKPKFNLNLTTLPNTSSINLEETTTMTDKYKSMLKEEKKKLKDLRIAHENLKSALSSRVSSVVESARLSSASSGVNRTVFGINH